MCVDDLPSVALDSGVAEIRTRDLQIANPAPYRYATEPHYIIIRRFRIDTEVRCVGAHPPFWPLEPAAQARVKPN